MPTRSEVAPERLPVELTEGGIEVEYADGRTVFYHGIPTPVELAVKTAPAKDVHVLVTDESESEGVLVYVDERKTEDGMLEDSGVGRVLLSDGEEATIFPGVTAQETQMRVDIEYDPSEVDGRVFVFEEDEMGERSFELVPEGEA